MNIKDAPERIILVPSSDTPRVYHWHPIKYGSPHSAEYIRIDIYNDLETESAKLRQRIGDLQRELAESVRLRKPLDTTLES